MRIDLNIHEFLALYGLLERQSSTPDKYLIEVYNRMRSNIIAILRDAEKDQFERWFDVTAKKVQKLEDQNDAVKRAEVFTISDDESDANYPRVQNQNRSRSNKRKNK